MPRHFRHVSGWSDFLPVYAEVLRQVPDGARLVEVGVWKGRSATYMAEAIKEANRKVEFHLVDSFDGGLNLGGVVQQSGFTPETLREHVLANLTTAGVRDRVTQVLTSLSWAAAAIFADGSLDFVFIDADHDYESVAQDLVAWWPKLKPGALFAGHDYPVCPGVVQAVDEFVARQLLKLEKHHSSWLTWKPKS